MSEAVKHTAPTEEEIKNLWASVYLGYTGMSDWRTMGALLGQRADLLKENERLKEAARAGIAYDAAIRGRAMNPESLSAFGTAQGEDLDTLYERWITLSRKALNP